MKKRKWTKVLGVVALGLVVVAIVFALVMPKPAAIQAVDVAALPDGIYEGRHDNGLIAAAVAVEVSDGQIVAVDLQQHRNGLGGAAEAIAQSVMAAQSLEVDAVSGATLSSNTILKAMANALTEEADT